MILAGNDQGAVSVYRMLGVEVEAEFWREQPGRMKEALSGHVQQRQQAA